MVRVMNQLSMGLMNANAAPPSSWKKSSETRESIYSFYYLDESGKIGFGEDQECESDAQALEYARKMLGFGGCGTIEVRLRNKRIGFVQAEAHLITSLVLFTCCRQD